MRWGAVSGMDVQLGKRRSGGDKGFAPAKALNQ